MVQRFQLFALVVLFQAAAACTAIAQTGWVKIATQTVDAAGEIAGFVPTGNAEGTAIRLEARQGKIKLQAVIVTFGQGRVHVEERPITLEQGERTRPIQFTGSKSPVRSVEVVLAPGEAGKASLEVWALTEFPAATTRPVRTTTVGPPPKGAPALKRDPVTGAYVIGSTKLGHVGFDNDAVPVGENPGFKTITLEAKDRGVSLSSVEVTYKDGTQDSVPIRTRLDPGQKQQLDLPSAKPVSNIAIKARSRFFDKSAKASGQSTIEITGQPAINPVSTSATRPTSEPNLSGPSPAPVSRGLGDGQQNEAIEAAKRAEEAARRAYEIDARRSASIDTERPDHAGGSSGLGGAGGGGGTAPYARVIEGLDACVSAKTCTPVPVFFGTNRNQLQTDGRISFGTARASQTQLGRVFVTVPSKNRSKGELNVPGTLDWIRGTPEGGDPKRHFTIPKSGITLYPSESDFVAAVKQHVQSGIGTHKDHAFVYVHGYRVPWEFAAMRTAQIAYDLSPDDAPFGTPFLYSWPSQAAVLDYATDLEVSRISTPHLVSFLRTVVEKTGATHVHVIAHSMGNVPVMNALAEISRTAPNVKFSQVILAAPDVEKQEFADLAKDVVKIAKGVTLYASSSDIALLVSRLVRRDKARAGDAKDPPGPSIVDGIDTVDISRLATGFMSYLSWNHDKYADSPVLLNDISTLFRAADKLKPNQRNISFRLQQAPAIQATFWRYQD